MGVVDQKIALITGAGQGVGQGIALALAGEGAKIAVSGRTASKLDVTCGLVRDRGGEAEPFPCDVKDGPGLAQLVADVVDRFGTVDILVNNAQEVPLGSLEDTTDEALMAGFESGALATMRLMKLCRPHLRGGGSIVNLASTAAKRWDMSGYGAYAATKEAIRSLTRAAACEWGEEGIRTNVILPHAKSPGLEWWIENKPEEAAEFMATIPMKRIGECEQDIGAFVVLLCSEGARYVNGQSIAIDGGQAHMG